MITIREAIAADYDALCSLFDEVDALHSTALPEIFRQPAGPARSAEAYSGLLADEHSALLVAGMGESIVGYVHAAVREALAIPIFVPRRYAVIDSIGVNSEWRRRGIAILLMRKAEEWARDKGATAIELNVWDFNVDAIELYESLGYQIASRRMSKSLENAAPETGQ